MRKLFLSIAVAALVTNSAKAEVTDCQEILSVPVIITTQGIHCLKSNKVSSATSGNLIDITVNNVTIDLNGFKLGGSGAGPATEAFGIFAQDRKNITIRNGSIRGFLRGVFLDQDAGTSSGHLLEDLLFDGNRDIGALVEGDGNIIRNNRVVNTGSGDPGTFAVGFWLIGASDTVIADNVISGTSETGASRGILVSDSALIEVRGNTILDAKDGVFGKNGIELGNSTDVTIIDNRILNATGTGTNGIIDLNNTSTGVSCFDNTILGFTTATNGCDLEAGTNPPLGL